MDVLMLGGTGFVGRHLVDALLARGHTVTLFNRGLQGPTLFLSCERLTGDRSHPDAFAALKDRRWDAVIDSNARMPLQARAAAAFFESRTQRYVFVSSISVYADESPEGAPVNISAESAEPGDEASPVQSLAEADLTDASPRTYGARKALCERWIREAFPHALLVVRPGLVVGPYDSTDRFTSWPVRFAEGGDILMPEGPEAPVRFIDARDLASWIARALENGTQGVFNAVRTHVAPGEKLTLGHVAAACLHAARAALAPPTQVHWVDTAFLEHEGVHAWSDLPAWYPNPGPLSSRRAERAGLTHRPLSETVADTLAWAQAAGLRRPLAVGLTREREAELLARWRQARSPGSNA